MKYGKVIISHYPFKNSDIGKKWSTRGRWPCKWISGAGNANPPFGIAYSRNIKLIEAKKFRIHVSADERYELFIDGELIGRGPECGAPDNWFYETYELELPSGKHNFTALVWSFGEMAPYAQMSIQHGFLLAAENKMHNQLSTGVACWKTQIIKGIKFRPYPYRAIGPKFSIDGLLFPWGIEKGLMSTSRKARKWDYGTELLYVNEFKQKHLLRPAVLPEPFKQKISSGKIRYVSKKLSGKISLDESLNEELTLWSDLLCKKSVTIKPGEARRIIIDLDNYYCAYPGITLSGGKGARLDISWAEALFTENKLMSPKHPRNEINSRYFLGIKDSFFPDGGTKRHFRLPWWRCGRYIELIVTTGTEPLRIDSLEFIETRYPLESESRIETDNDKHSAIFETSLRTLQMCLHETYMDCPYYEQLMYLGDTRLQMLTNYTISRDNRPVRKAIELIKDSIMPNGLTQSRYPSRITQIIPPFSLWWVGMVYDFALWRVESDFIREIMPSVRYVLDCFSKYLNKDGLLEGLPGWNFVDWPPEWRQNKDQGMPPDAEFGVSGVINWQYAYTLRLTADLHSMLGDTEFAEIYRQKGQILADKLIKRFYDNKRELLTDTLDKKHFSEHTQSLAILSGYLGDSLKAKLGESLLNAPGITRTTVYFTHYLFETFKEIGAEEAFFARLTPWMNIEESGLKTLLEEPEPSRSDCHAWSAHPLYHFYTTIAGIMPDALGFKKVKIKPMLGSLKKLDLDMVHPEGRIKASYRKINDDSLSVKISLPENISGELNIDGAIYPISAGKNSFKLDIKS